ncbi:hypothetical protein Tco_0119212, partial [Tanacetum coccineum]
MEDEHLDTIPVTESANTIKSSVEDLVPTPSESADLSDDERECDVPVNDESSPTFATFSNPLFDSKDDFTSSDDELLSDEDEFSDSEPEEEIRLAENLSYDNSSPRPPEERNSDIADTIIESLSPPPIPVKKSTQWLSEFI